MYFILANLVALIHATYIIFLLWAIFVSLWGRLHLYKWAQILLTIWVLGKIASYLIFENCILTMSERFLREKAGDSSYTSGFIEHYSQILGISLSNDVIAWLVIAPVALVVLSEAYWHNRRRIKMRYQKGLQ